MAAAAGIVAAQRKHRTYFKRLPIRNVGGPRVVSSEQRRGACADAALEREAAREREVRMQRALDGLTHVPYIGVLVSETPSVSPANWAMKRGLVATAVQLSQRRLTFAFVLLPSSATPSVLELLPRDLFELVGHVLQCLPAGLAEVRFTEADTGCTIRDNGVVLETPCLTEREGAISPTRAPPRDIITVDRCGCQDSPPHAELVRTAVCAVNCIATDGMSSVSLVVERNEHAGKIMLGFVSAPCGGLLLGFCGRPPHSGAAAGDRIVMRVNADERFVELKQNGALLGRVACSMPFYGDGFGSLCCAVGSDSDGCRVRIESADPALFDPHGDALADAAAHYARDHPVRFCEASSYYNTTAEGGRLATTLRVVDHGRLAPCDVIICDAIPGKHSVLFEVVHQQWATVCISASRAKQTCGEMP